MGLAGLFGLGVGCADAESAMRECPESFSGNSFDRVDVPEYETCMLPRPCAAVTFDQDLEPRLQNPEARSCVLEALAAGEAAELRISSSYASGSFGNQRRIQLMPEGRVLWFYDNSRHSGNSVGISAHRLDESYDFSQCAEEETASDLANCIRAGMLECVDWLTVPELCGG